MRRQHSMMLDGLVNKSVRKLKFYGFYLLHKTSHTGIATQNKSYGDCYTNLSQQHSSTSVLDITDPFKFESWMKHFNFSD